MRIDWSSLGTAAADVLDGVPVEITGWMVPIEIAAEHSYFMLVPEEICCFGCLPSDPLAAVEIFAAAPIALGARAVRLAGRWCRLIDDPAGWCYQLRAARLIAVEHPPVTVTRRGLLAAGALLGLGTAFCGAEAATELGVTVDLHSHAGRVLGHQKILDVPFLDVAADMRDGGMTAICLAIVADAPTTQTIDGRIVAVRDPAPGELYQWGLKAFARLHALVQAQNLAVITSAADLDRSVASGPGVIVAAEGADFLEGQLDRVDEAYEIQRLRHLQLTHYRVNELGDIQTAVPVHGGLTDFGAAVIGRCNQLGIVVDVAHGTYDLVKRAVSVTTKPLVLSHTSLSDAPAPRSRRISADHAQIIADTGGVIGIWPPSSEFADMASFAAGMARMVDKIGVDHVGLGSDMLGLLVPAIFSAYRQLPVLAEELRRAGFQRPEIAKLLGGNYARVFTASVSSSLK
jgi:membrane dipeptidase